MQQGNLVRRFVTIACGLASILPLGCGGSGGGGNVPLLTPNSIDFEVDAEAARRTLQVVEMVFDATDFEVEEGAVLASGRRRLLRFDTVVRNMGELDCVIGGHGHYHLEGWASYELRIPDGTLAAIGHKQSFCITDSIPVLGGAPSQGFDCAFQGLSWG
jgi:hypothetical protein